MHAGTVPVYRPLGAIRLALALLVVLQHFQYLLPPPEPLLFSHLGLGMVAVAVFFVISGFVVTEACMTFYGSRPGSFLGNRLLTVAPPYFAALLVAATTQTLLWHAGRLQVWDQPLQGSPLDPRLLASGVLGLVPGFHTRMLAGQDFEFIPFSWTLRVEMAFYLAVCLVLLAGRLTGRRILLFALAATWLACAAFLWRMRPGFLSSGPMFLSGVAGSVMLRQGGWKPLAFLAACLALTPFAFASYGQRGEPILWMQLLLIAGLLVSLACVVCWRTTPRLRYWDRRLGDLSYPLYLNHYAVGILLYDTVPSPGTSLYLAGLLMSVGLAWVMGQLVERPLAGLRTRIRGTAF